MGLRRWLLILLCVVASPVWADDTPEVPGQIRLASETWNDYTNADGSGLAWDVLREVFEPAGVKDQDPQRALHPFGRSGPAGRSGCLGRLLS